MNSDDIVTIFMGLFAAIVVMSPVACTAYRYEKITQVIESGIAPAEASCAFNLLSVAPCQPGASQ